MPGLPEAQRISSLDTLHPAFRARVERGLSRARAEGLAVHPFETLRSPARQNRLWAQGRTTPGKIVTNARAWESLHQYGLAADFAFDGDPSTAKIDWTWNGKWTLLGEIMMAEGLEWLGAPGSGFTEAPHFQFKAGLSFAEIKDIHRRFGLEGLAAAIDQRLRYLATEEGT
jgi:peptidoglycan L-alanyl-D-glutamate endopeptidase CwlK